MGLLGSDPVVVAACVVLGLLIGSYLGVVADRTIRGEPTSTGRSHCDACGATLRWFELLPVISWIVQLGRCRRCGARIPAAVLAIEAVTSAAFGAVGARFGQHWELGGFLVLTAGTIALSAIDLRTQTLPRRIILTTAALSAPFLIAGALAAHEPRRLLMSTIGAAIGLAVFFAIWWLSPASMGDGDVRLAGLLGLHLGWIGLLHVPVGLFAGFLFGAVVGVALLARGRAGRKTAIPFGPFMSFGAFVVILAGRQIIDAWLPR